MDAEPSPRECRPCPAQPDHLHEPPFGVEPDALRDLLARGSHGFGPDMLEEAGGEGGVIAMDPAGNIAMSFNSAGMYRASISTNGELFVGIYQD